MICCSYIIDIFRIFLENISYEALGATAPQEKGKKLGCKDSIVAQLKYPVGVKVIFNRRLAFEPEELFELSVSFGAELKFNPEKRDLVDWKHVNVAHEFQVGCPTLMAALNARCTLLVAQITSSAGASPVIPLPAKNANLNNGN